ncbi:HTTM domain-containing protein [Pseudonocardia pini]|uniref:HTTM domain-containing protein n=1 Tax=Pseudonocardia pini TaxID=2758030 RepID=UPI0015F01F27|nr:HTTM domain-containing protein [Pseudonocardia pini]
MLRLPETLPARPVAAYRVVLGLVAVVRAAALTANPYLGNRPHPLYGWVPALPTPVWTAVGLVMLVAAVALVLGVLARPAALVVGLCVFAEMWGAGYYGNGAYLLGTMAILLSFSRCDAAFALRGRPADEVWAPPVLLLRAQISVVYLYAALGKLNQDYLVGNGLAGDAGVLVPAGLLVFPLVAVLAVGAVVLELFLAVALWVPRLRPVAIPLGVLLHLGMIAWLSDGPLAVMELGCFAATTAGGYLLFLDALPSRRGRGRSGRSRPTAAGRRTSPHTASRSVPG